MASKDAKHTAKHRAFVIGSPIEHSLSPKLHGFWIQHYGIDGSYEAINCPPEYFVKTIKKLASTGYEGGNVTIPHKEKALMAADSVDELARKVGAANTLIFKDGKIHATNTDVHGFTKNLLANGVALAKIKSALVIGAGGAARAIIVALKEKNINVTITNRTLENAVKLGKEFDVDIIDWHEKEAALPNVQLVVNTTSLGMKGQGELEINLSSLPKNAVVSDIVYNPLETPLLKQASELGLKAVDGLGMLLHQAVPGFEKWFGKTPEVTQELYNELAKKFR